MLCIVGGGLSAEYLTLKAISALMKADTVYVDSYTSIAPGIDAELVSKLNPRAKIVVANRRLLEEGLIEVMEEARQKHVVVLVPGDPYTATTHIILRLEAVKRGIRTCSIAGVSGIQAVIDASGLQFYRFGKTITLVYPEGFKPYSVVEAIIANRSLDLHTLLLLDLKLEENRAMTIPDAISLLLELEKEYAEEHGIERFLPNTRILAIARAGLLEEKCIYGLPSHLLDYEYPPPPHSIIIPAPRLHPVEEEALDLLCEKK